MRRLLLSTAFVFALFLLTQVGGGEPPGIDGVPGTPGSRVIARLSVGGRSVPAWPDARYSDLPLPERPADASYSVIRRRLGVSVRWDPCTPIRYVLRSGTGPPNAQQLVSEGIRRLERATGLRFEPAGETILSAPEWQRAPDAERGASVWIGWARSSEFPVDRAHHADRVGVTIPRFDVSQGRISTAVVMLLEDDALVPEFRAGPSYGSVLLHELGHLAGLDHSRSVHDVMYPFLGPRAPESWGPGDRAGLYDLGNSQPCLPREN